MTFFMRRPVLTSLFVAIAFVLSAPSASADAKAKATPVTMASVAEQVALSARGDAELVSRASRVRELPRGLEVRERAQLTQAASLFRRGSVDAGRAVLSQWVSRTRASADDATVAILWVTREAIAAQRADLVQAAARVADVDARVLGLEATVANLRVAATRRRDVYVGVPGAGAASAKRTEHVSHEDLATRLAEAEQAQERAVAERTAARDAFSALQGGSRAGIAALVSVVRVAVERDRQARTAAR